MSDVLERIDRLKQELDAVRPLPPDTVARVGQKLRIESSYHSNAVEGNSLTLGETRSLILHGLTAHGKPMRDHLDIEGHNEAVKAVEDAVSGQRGLTEVFIRQLHAVLLKESYEVDAQTPNGSPARHRIEIGAYKSRPNNVRTSTGEIYYFTSPEQVKPAMSDLMAWYDAREAAGEHPVALAAAFHYRFVRIHPFDDGNGRMARLLMNMILIRHGYTVAIVRREDRDLYIQELEQADKTEDLAQFIDYIASCCEYALDLHLKAARGEPVEQPDDIDREIALFKQSFVRRESTDKQVDVKKYVEGIVCPFREFCVSKIDLFSDIFSSTSNPMCNVKGVDSNEKTFSVFLNESERDSDVPESGLEVSSVIHFTLLGFRGTNTITEIKIESEFNSTASTWKFSLDYRPVGSCNGHDLDELKNQFNQLLRAMMDDLRRQVPRP